MTTYRACLLLLIVRAAAGAETLPTAPTIYNQPKEEILVQPTSQAINKGRLVKDPAERTGWAICADPADMPGVGWLWYGYTYNQGPGKVRVTYRLKVADNTSPQPVVEVQVNFYDNDLKQNPNREEFIRGTDFKAPNTWQDFVFDTTKGEAGFGGWGVQTLGVTTICWDGMTVDQLSRFTTGELLPLLNLPERPKDLVLATDSFRVHETSGLYMPLWRVNDAVKLLAGQRTQSTLHVHPQQTRLAGYPAKWEALYSQAVMVLNNVPAKAVGIVGCQMLKQYVEDGGCVVLLGDTHSLAAGGWADSALGPLLPVTLAGPKDVRLPAKPLFLEPRDDAFRQLHWSAKPYTVYYHRAALRPGARVLLAAGQIPLVVEEPVGKGRIIVILASVLGDPNPKVRGVPFWQWSDWPALMAELLRTR